MVDDSTCDDIVSWTENGWTQFTIHQTNEFASELVAEVSSTETSARSCGNSTPTRGALAISPRTAGPERSRGTLPLVSRSAHARVRLLARLCARGRGGIADPFACPDRRRGDPLVLIVSRAVRAAARPGRPSAGVSQGEEHVLVVRERVLPKRSRELGEHQAAEGREAVPTSPDPSTGPRRSNSHVPRQIFFPQSWKIASRPLADAPAPPTLQLRREPR